MNYFSLFPTMQDAYSGSTLRNITLAVKLQQPVNVAEGSVFPYTIKDGERPTTVAYNYYGDIGYVWLIAFANHIIDLTTQWPKSGAEFSAYITSKYGSIAAAQSTVLYYTLNADASYPNITPVTYTHMSSSDQDGCTAVTQYDYEQTKNEAARSIVLIDKGLAPNILFEIGQALQS